MHSFGTEKIQETRAFYQALKKSMINVGMGNKFDAEIDAYTREFIRDVSRYIFTIDTENVKYVFPFLDFEKNNKIVLYGAGKVGQSYYKDILNHHIFQITGWIDTNYAQIDSVMGVEIQKPEDIKIMDYDYIIIAVYNSQVAEDIKNQLIQLQVNEKKIRWYRPIISA